MLQIAYALAKDPTIKTDVTLIFANTSVGDIILKDVLDGMAKEHSNFHVHHVVSLVCFALHSCCGQYQSSCWFLGTGRQGIPSVHAGGKERTGFVPGLGRPPWTSLHLASCAATRSLTC